MAASLIQDGRFVIAVGRRQEHLNSFVQKHGEDNAVSFQFDISQLDEIPNFVKRYLVPLSYEIESLQTERIFRWRGQCNIVPPRFGLRFHQLGDPTPHGFQ